MNFKSTGKCLLLTLLCLFSLFSQGQVAAWNNSALTGTTAGSPNASTADINLNTPVLSRGSGIIASSLTGGYASNNWMEASVASAITNNKFYQVSLSAKTNYKVSLSTLDFKLRRSSSGPNAYLWRYSIDGTNFTDIGSAVSFTTATTTGDVQPQLNLAGITALQNVNNITTITLRLYAWGATSVGGTMAFGTGNVNSIALGGTVVSSISANADLSGLSVSMGTLTPSFSKDSLNYSVTVSNAVTSITVTPTSGDANATIAVNGNGVTSGTASASVALNVGSNTITTMVTAQNGTTTKTYSIIATRAAAGTPLFASSATLANFGEVCINTTSAANSFTLNGTDLDGSNVALAALNGFSYAETIAGTYTSTLNFSYAGSSFSDKIIYVKFTPSAVESYNGNILISGGGINSFNVAVTGSGINAIPVVSTTVSTLVTATTATIAGVITNIGCSPILTYGFEYSTNSGFTNGSGTIVNVTNLNSGNFSANISGLAPNTRYYYKAFATSNSGTGYGSQLVFTNTPLAVKMSDEPGLSFTENFADINNWSNFFVTGIGANHFNGISANATGTIPDGIKITAQTNTFQGATFGSSGGVQKGTDQVPASQSIVLLSTGSADNSTAAALDFFIDFTGLNAGTLSFDWASVNNSTGDRNGSMKVFSSTDGISFTELNFASVLNLTNNLPTNGSKTNIALPVSFNNSATARLRFYYYNATGGITPTGSRPKISIDNLIVTAVATTPCSSPAAAPTSLSFGTITDVSIQAMFSTASPSSDGYLVVMSTNNSLTSNPINGQIYNVGDNVGDGSVVAKGSSTSFTANSLTASTNYYFYIFSFNGICTGGPLYYTNSVLTGTASTIAGLPACATPTGQPADLIFNTTTTNSIQGSFTDATAVADEFLVLRSTSTSLSANPVNGQNYNSADVLGNAVVVQRGNNLALSANGLTPNTAYYFFIFSVNSQACVNGPVYNITAPLSGTQSTHPLPACTTPTAQPTTLTLTAGNTRVSGTFTGVPDADHYLIIRSSMATLSETPVNNSEYNKGDNFGGGTVMDKTTVTSFLSAGLSVNTPYYYFVFAANTNCSGGIKYAGGAALSATINTSNTPVNNVYFGSLHAHSDYSDGNKDNPGYTPADNYNIAMTAQCMDYLGISEHNHYSNGDPGNKLATYRQGTLQSDAFSAANPNFLALYGMEWGVISGGGHVVVYGDGMNDLWGWESGSGVWGPSNNYDTYVPKNVYTGSTGLFKTINDNAGKNTFASLAHPNQNDYNNIANLAYDALADNAIAASAVETGPATSTNTTYGNPGLSLNYLWYYQLMLSKGYHLGPTIDHDNHNTTFGKTTYSRTAIVAPSLSKTNIIGGMKNMNFYATQDCDSKVDFSINTKIMGSLLSDRYGPNISVSLTDATTSTATAIIRVMFGIPGSGVLPVKVDSVIGNNLNYYDANLTDGATGYYYLDITNGSARIITSPIWYTRNDFSSVVPVKLTSFTVQKNGSSAYLKWSTAQELESKSFEIERSPDGKKWNTIGSVSAAGNSTKNINYAFTDQDPLSGLNYYRLKEVNTDDKFSYSFVKTVLFNHQNSIVIAPNPSTDFVTIYMNTTGNILNQIIVSDINGKILENRSSSDKTITINTSTYAKGIYLIKVSGAGNTSTQKIIVQ